MKLTCRGYTPGLIGSPPSFLSRSFLERVGPGFSAVLFFAFPFETDTVVLVGFFFISDPLAIRVLVKHNAAHLTR